MTIYRKIYEQYHGPIPDGYHIHHVDGNHSNNAINNLICVSPREHYDIHYEQGDYMACFLLIRTGHLDLTAEQRSEISRLAQKQRIENGTHHFLWPKEWRRDYTGSNNPNFGNKWSVEQRKELSLLRKTNGKSAGKNNPMYGRKRSDLTAMNIANRGKHWYTDGITSKQCFPSEVPDGWYKGRTIKR